MLDAPEFGQRKRVWPMPGRKAQLDERPVDALGGGRFMPKNGVEVVWSEFRMNQLRAGDLLLHPPPCEKHDHGDTGQDECMHCGRSVEEAQKYNVDFSDGVKAAKAAAELSRDHKDGIPLHPLERHQLRQAELAALRKARQEREAAEAAAKAAAPAPAPAPAPASPPAPDASQK